MTPTDTSLSIIEPNSRISSIWDTTSHNTMNTRMPMKTFSDLDSFISR